jgi:hypothetical protein
MGESLISCIERLAIEASAGFLSASPQAEYVPHRLIHLIKAAKQARPPGLCLEFGVGHGGSLGLLQKEVGRTIGFDSFTGLPEDWRPGFPRGSFACDPPKLPDLVIGRIEETLPKFIEANSTPWSFVHIDTDLYSVAALILEIGLWQIGSIIVFDEHHGYPGWQLHEAAALAEWPGRYDVISYSEQQLAIRIK